MRRKRRTVECSIDACHPSQSESITQVRHCQAQCPAYTGVVFQLILRGFPLAMRFLTCYNRLATQSPSDVSEQP